MVNVAVLVPGTGYTTQRPLLHWAGVLLGERGWQVREVSWTVTDGAFADPLRFVERHVEAVFDGEQERRLIVAKSFGCFALPWATRENVPGVWLTPVLSDPVMRTALAGASARHLAVGGGLDPMWRAEALEGCAAELVTVPQADHSLQSPGDWGTSFAAQGGVLRRIEAFVDGLDT